MERQNKHGRTGVLPVPQRYQQPSWFNWDEPNIVNMTRDNEPQVDFQVWRNHVWCN